MPKKTPFTGPLAVTCPTLYCGAKPGKPCVDHDARMLGTITRHVPHAARYVEAMPDTDKTRLVKRVANNPHSLPRGY